MASKTAVTALKKGRNAFYELSGVAKGVHVDLRGANLRDLDLSWFQFIGCDLTDADLRHSDVRGSYFGPEWFSPVARDPRGASPDDSVPTILSGAKFDHAELLTAVFNYVRLDQASFRNSGLNLATFRGCNLKNVRLSAAHMFNTSFCCCDISGAIGLDAISHSGPSFLDIETLRSSLGALPASFLQGVGLPKNAVEYLPSIFTAEDPIQFYSCFVSHATADRDFCDRLVSRMRDAGMRVWYAPEDIKGGRKIVHQIDEAIRVHDKLILVLSKNSIQSDWVKQEILRARRRERRGTDHVLFPISLMPFTQLSEWELIDEETGEDLAAEIRSYYVPDFSEWRSVAAIESGLAALLRDIKVNRRGTA